MRRFSFTLPACLFALLAASLADSPSIADDAINNQGNNNQGNNNQGHNNEEHSNEGQVTFELFEGLPSHAKWFEPQQLPDQPVMRWDSNACFLHRLPHRYEAWGIRDSWKATVLVRATCYLNLPRGESRWLIRTRGLSRLLIDDQVVASTKTMSGATDGHQPVQPLPVPPTEGLSAVGYGDQEAFGKFSLDQPKRSKVVFEFMVGGAKFRANPGTTLVAYAIPGEFDYKLLGCSLVSQEITDAYLLRCQENTEQQLLTLDDQHRRAAASSRDSYWNQRRAWNKNFLTNLQESEKVITGNQENTKTTHPVDAFIHKKLESRQQAESPNQSSQELDLAHRAIELLEAKCYRCHGEKAKGGLRLDKPEHAVQEADSGLAAIIPGDANSSELIFRVGPESANDPMPPSGSLKEEEVQLLADWISQGATWPNPQHMPNNVELAAVVDDESFLRRVTFDAIGLPPTLEEVREFIQDTSDDKRQRAIDRLLDDPRWADHWVSYWQDVLAENPNFLKPSLNNTGPFRWYLYEALRDRRAWDRLVFDLIMMRGSEREGGSAGFGFAAENDAPMAAKAHIIGAAFLGIDMKCARCHDSPYSSPTQRDLFSLASMLRREPSVVPKSSMVAPGFFDSLKGRESLIRVTLKPQESVSAKFPFEQLLMPIDEAQKIQLLENPADSRERLAFELTGAHNRRFAQVMVNRVWKRLFGQGIVEPVNDWEGAKPSHPEMLEWLADQFIASGYDAKNLLSLIMTSEAYQRTVLAAQQAPSVSDSDATQRYFASQSRRRLTAEQLIDSLFYVTQTSMRAEELTFDQESRRPANSMISLGVPERAWMFATLANERDRPSLNLPRAQAIVDVMEVFGWNGSRQNPIHQRDGESNVLQPGILAGSPVTTWVTRASVANGLADWAIAADNPNSLIEDLFIRFLSRRPTSLEAKAYTSILESGFEQRIVPDSERITPLQPEALPHISWANHLSPEANTIKLEMERRVHAGDAPDPRLRSQWRERYEDVIWSLVNSPEFVWLP